MTIYIDILFLINLIIDMAVNFTALVLCDNKIRFLKLLTVSAIGAVYAVLAVLFSFFSLKIVVFIYIIINVFLLFGKSNFKVFLKRLILYCTSAIFCLGICQIFLALNTKNYVSINNIEFFPAKDISIYISTIALCLSAKLLKATVNHKKVYFSAELRLNNIKLPVIAYYDTGNTLVFQNKPVIIISEQIAEKLNSNDYVEILYKTVSDETQKMQGILIDELYFTEEKTSIKNILCGIGNISEKDFQVLLNKRTYP